METLSVDLAVIGAGAAGLSVAAGAAQLGAKVILIEARKMGGDCLNYGCVPSKALLSAAKSFYQVKKGDYFGIRALQLKIDFSAVMMHVHKTIAILSKNDSAKRFESLGVKVIQEQGKFLDPRTLQTKNYTIKAKRFIIATGSYPFVPPIPGLNQVPYETNETIFNLKELPQHLIVIGGGPIGCELAQAFAMLGAKVSILEGFKILPKDDSDCVALIRRQFEAMNIAIFENCKVHEINKNAEGIGVKIELKGEFRQLIGSHLLVATGRRPDVEGLDLKKAQVAYSPKGIQVDAHLRTSNKKIYALGDVIGAFQFTHVSNYHAGIVLRNILFKLPSKVDYHALPWVTYTEPEMAHVGMLGEEALKRSDTQITEHFFDENDRAQTEHETQGKIKIITNKRGKILGVTIVGSHAGELILPWVMALREKKTLRSFMDTIIPYPTLNEISKQVASDFYAPKLFAKNVRWLVNLLLKFS